MTEQPSRSVERIDPAYAAAMPAPQGGALPTGLEWQALERMAGTLADSDVIPYRLKRKPADVAVILLAAREYGIPPLMALSKLPVVNGTPAPMGELMVALVLRAGHSIRADFKAPDGTRYKGGPLTPEHYGEAIVRRRDWPDGVEESLTFTLEEATNAGLVRLTREGRPVARDNKDQPTPWELYTPNMARWRAVANVCRLYFPDVLLGLSYLPEELGAIVDAEGAPIVGEVVEQTHRRAAPTGTQEQRQAQEYAGQLAGFVGPPETLDNVLEHAEANGFADEVVDYDGDRLPLRAAIARRREWLEANTVTAEAHDTPSEAASAPETPEQPSGDTETPAEASQDAQPDEGDVVDAELAEDDAPLPTAPGAAPMSDEELARESALAALEESDVDTLRYLWSTAKDRNLLEADVMAVVTEDDLAAMGITETGGRVPLGGLLQRVNGYVTRHGVAVRSQEFASSSTTSDGPDPWADGSGTATTSDGLP